MLFREIWTFINPRWNLNAPMTELTPDVGNGSTYFLSKGLCVETCLHI